MSYFFALIGLGWLPQRPMESAIPAVLIAAGVLWIGGCDENSRCVDEVNRLEACGLSYSRGEQAVCADPVARCELRCTEELGCSELRASYLDGQPFNLENNRCLWACADGFECDGETGNPMITACDGYLECQDGQDEVGCSYHMCDDGQSVSRGSECDGYPQCMDKSDENDC